MTNNLTIKLNNYISILKMKEANNIKLNSGELTDADINFCIYLTNNVIDDIIHIAKNKDIELTENKIIFCIRFLGEEIVNEKTLFLLHGIINNDKIVLNYFFPNLLPSIISLLEQLKEKVNLMDKINNKEKVKIIK